MWYYVAAMPSCVASRIKEAMFSVITICCASIVLYSYSEYRLEVGWTLGNPWTPARRV